MDRQIEILAPAGSEAAMKAAFRAGADAVYMGGRLFGARAYAQNPEQDGLLAAIDYAHLHGKKLYLTVNTLLKNEEISESLYSYMLPLYRQGLDAVLVQDFGVMKFLADHFPELPLHASTQMTVYGSDYANWLKKYHINRIVTPRELTLEEIRSLKQETGLDIEVFIHGALCCCYSGQCLMSSMIGGRSGNRGRCAQPCRLPYAIGSGKRKTQGYLLSPKDLCGLDLLPELIDAGVDSLKIEGRMKGPEYAALTASIYRKYADLYLEKGTAGFHVEESDRKKLLEMFNRGGFTDGYFTRHNGPEMISKQRPGHAGVRIGTGTAQRGIARISLSQDTAKGDLIELPGGQEIRLKESAAAGSTLRLTVKGRLPEGKFPVMRTQSKALSEELSAFTEGSDLQEIVSGKVKIYAGLPAQLEVSGSAGTVCVAGAVPQPALKRPLQASETEARLRKTGGTHFTFDSLEVDLEDGVFMPVPEINELRRQALAAYEEMLYAQFRREENGHAEHDMNKQCEKQNDLQETAFISVLVTTSEQLKEVLSHPIVHRVYVNDEGDAEWMREAADLTHAAGREFYPALAHVWRMEQRDKLEERIRILSDLDPDGFLVRNMDSYLALKRLGNSRPVIADYGIYAMNDIASGLILGEFDGFTLPVELNRRELENLADYESGEMIAYGRIPLMLTAQCQQKNTYGCTHRPGWLYLEDRMHKHFPVRNVCSSCYNIIYNSVPLFLTEAAGNNTGQKPGSFRLQLTEETAEQSADILQVFERVLAGGVIRPEDLPEHTKGHYKRGVE